MFIVIVTHNTGHGESSCPALVTDDFQKVYETVRRVDLKYEFYSHETGFVVYRVSPGITYAKDTFKATGIINPCVFTRMWYRDAWHEEWFDKNLEQLVKASKLDPMDLHHPF